MSFVLLSAILAGCSSTYHLGPKEQVGYAGYSYRNVYIVDNKLKIPGELDKSFRNIRFCFRFKLSCVNVFETDNQYMNSLTFIDRELENGKRIRVFLVAAFDKDTNDDGLVNTMDLSSIYAYQPLTQQLHLLQKDVIPLDLESNVDTYTFFILYDRNGHQYITQYDLRDLKPLKTVER